jgi:hypothetical protein
MLNPVSSTAPGQELDACEHSVSSGSEHDAHFKNKSNCMPLLYMFTSNYLGTLNWQPEYRQLCEQNPKVNPKNQRLKIHLANSINDQINTTNRLYSTIKDKL